MNELGQSLSDEVRRYLKEIGRRGGAAGRGAAKARPSAQARAAVLKRWQSKRANDAERQNPKAHAKGSDHESSRICEGQH
jgi:hypothetical protein